MRYNQRATLLYHSKSVYNAELGHLEKEEQSEMVACFITDVEIDKTQKYGEQSIDDVVKMLFLHKRLTKQPQKIIIDNKQYGVQTIKKRSLAHTVLLIKEVVS